jgi:hypothetical protein
MIACFDFSSGRESGNAASGGGEPGEANAPTDRFANGAPNVISRDSPRPEDFAGKRTDAEVRALFARKAAVREQGIQRILDAEKDKGRVIDRYVAAIKYDSDLAPRTTNRRQLLELGIDAPAANAIPKSDIEVHRALWSVIYGLARLGIYLTATGGLSDRALLIKLCSAILDEEVRDIPPSADMSEFIDVAPFDHPPDGLEGPFEFNAEDDDANEFTKAPHPQPSWKPSSKRRAIDRDRLLPRPASR